MGCNHYSQVRRSSTTLYMPWVFTVYKPLYMADWIRLDTVELLTIWR